MQRGLKSLQLYGQALTCSRHQPWKAARCRAEGRPIQCGMTPAKASSSVVLYPGPQYPGHQRLALFSAAAVTHWDGYVVASASSAALHCCPSGTTFGCRTPTPHSLPDSVVSSDVQTLFPLLTCILSHAPALLACIDLAAAREVGCTGCRLLRVTSSSCCPTIPTCVCLVPW